MSRLYNVPIFDVRLYKGGKILTIREKDVGVSIATSDSYSYFFLVGFLLYVKRVVSLIQNKQAVKYKRGCYIHVTVYNFKIQLSKQRDGVAKFQFFFFIYSTECNPG